MKRLFQLQVLVAVLIIHFVVATMFGFVSTPILTDGIGSLLELPENRTNYDKLSDFIAKGQRRASITTWATSFASRSAIEFS
jgi:hypothetical protein